MIINNIRKFNSKESKHFIIVVSILILEAVVLITVLINEELNRLAIEVLIYSPYLLIIIPSCILSHQHNKGRPKGVKTYVIKFIMAIINIIFISILLLYFILLCVFIIETIRFMLFS